MADVSLAELEKGFKEGKSGPTTESIISEFWSGKNIEYKTEIPRPLPMSILDGSVEYVEEEFGKEVAKTQKSILKWYRINMVSHKRKSRAEVGRALAAGAGIVDVEQKRMSEKLLGR